MPIQSWSQTLVVAQGDGTALTAAATASALPPAAKFTLPANFFDTIGKSLRVQASGRVSTVITTPGTFQWQVKFGATAVFDSLSILPDTVAGHTNVGWLLDILLVCRVVGTSAALFGQGTFTSEDILGVPATAPKGVLSAVLPWNSAPASGTTFDSTASQQVDLAFTQTAATGSLTLHNYLLTSLN